MLEHDGCHFPNTQSRVADNGGGYHSDLCCPLPLALGFFFKSSHVGFVILHTQKGKRQSDKVLNCTQTHEQNCLRGAGLGGLFVANRGLPMHPVPPELSPVLSAVEQT